MGIIGGTVMMVWRAMKITTKVFKRKSGKSKGKWVVRVEYVDSVLGGRKTV